MAFKHFALHVESGWILRNVFSLKDRRVYALEHTPREMVESLFLEVSKLSRRDTLQYSGHSDIWSKIGFDDFGSDSMILLS